ncbi:MAG: fluoride efflux transporter CrcB [Candidatus Aquicultorales bacterium]
MNFLWVGVGGFLGAMARYAISGLIGDYAKTNFPLGTFIVNTGGSFVLGIFVAVATERLALDSNTRLFVGTGFLGAYTTFSTFTFESVRLVEHGNPGVAIANVLFSAIAGLLAVYAGLQLGKSV